MKRKFEKAEKLFSYALMLNAKQEELGARLFENTTHLKRSLEAGKNASQQERVQKFYDTLLITRNEHGKRMIELVATGRSVFTLFRQSNMPSKFAEIDQILKKADLTQVPNFETIYSSEDRMEFLYENSIPMWQYFIGVTQIATYFLIYFECEIYGAFLDYPSVPEKLLDSAISIARAVAEEFIGKVIPFFGVIESVVEIAKPRLLVAIEKIKEATQVMDRLYNLDDRMLDLSSYTQTALAIANFSAESVQENEVRFGQKADEIINMWSNFL